MYDKRIKIFVILVAAFFLICLLRLIQMQLLSGSSVQGNIAELKRQRGVARQLKTVRGKILDRNGRVLAVDEPQFQLCINYTLGCFLDERVQNAKLLRASGKQNAERATSKVRNEIEGRLEDLQQIINKCALFGPEGEDIENKIRRINDKIWNLRTYLTRKRAGLSIADFKKKFPNPNDRLIHISRTDIVEMHKSYPLLELKTDDDIFTAQLEFADVNGISILPKARRFYPYSSVAAQTIGWVGQAQPDDKKLFENDELSSYLEGELCGRDDGVEYVCEPILRGRRGEVFYDIDGKRVERAVAEFGRDVKLTLDIELQKKIENYLTNCEFNPNCEKPTAAVVIDVATGQILALVSLPVFDLNRIRYNYGDIVSDANEPLRNRAINKQYPPGSVVKPMILIAGLESGKITPDEIISCPAEKAPKGWPNCWLYNRYHLGHDDKWEYDGGNNARNAIKGSCNIYFSRLADRIEPSVLQQWLLRFGYGKKIPLSATITTSGHEPRELRQAPGKISSGKFKDVIAPQDRRWFGIGQGDFRTTPLQVANAMAVIARGGLYKSPQLFVVDDPNNSKFSSITLNISPQTLDIVRDGMSAVVNEEGGTAYEQFAYAGFAERDVKVYGKTGSTEKPANAWFAGFAEDNKGHSISIAVVVEGGRHGSSDAAPLARNIIGFCIEDGYVGQSIDY